MRFFGAFCALSMFLAPLSAQTADSEAIARLISRIDQLERRVNELEAEKLARTQAPGAAMPGMSHGTAAESFVAESADMSRPNLHLAGFSDLNFVASDLKGSHSGFTEGQFIFHITSQLSRKVNYFGELSMTARTDPGLGTPPAAGFNVEVERSIIRYEQNDLFKLSFGRYHTPINYWNTAFHHGSWLQTTASRPEMVQFGGSFIPVHFVGALAEGTSAAHGLNATYNVGFGNGRGEVISRAGDYGDINNNRAWLINSFIRPDKLNGIQIGGSVYRDKVNAVGLPAYGEWIEAFHFVREKENPEIIAEFANVRHRPSGGGTVSNSQAWYVQLAWRAPFADRKLKPYYRYEYIHIPRSDLLFRRLSGLSESIAGIRYDISNFSALKFEYRSVDRPGLPRTNVGWAQTSFTF
jgi:hypothetical protein